jgi:chromosome segregation ATPase
MDMLNKIYNTIISEINKNNYFTYDNHIDTFNNANNDEFMQLLTSIDAIINQILRYLSSIYDEKNLMSKEIDNCKNTISDFQNINDNLVQENNDYKIKLYNGNNTNSFQDNYNKYEQMNHILEKKIKNYETEIELKQMQINSLEEIIRRRGNNVNQNTESNDVNENYNNSQNLTIKRLEQDREKLIKDNMKLIQYNKKLKEQINNLNQIINSLSWNNSNIQEKSNMEINNNELQ